MSKQNSQALHSSVEPETAQVGSFQRDVLHGLSVDPKYIAPKYFYDAHGSALFDQICMLPEYYPTRVEQSILDAHAPAMAEALGAEVMLIEPGAGSSVKTRTLLRAMKAPAAYLPIDISGDYLHASARALRDDFPGLRVEPIVADFTASLTLPALGLDGHRRAIFFPGSTLGNFEPEAARALLSGFRRLVGADGALLLGVDLEKDIAMLEAAYDDVAGVTAKFNLNLLIRINRELSGQFNLDRFAHRAFYNTELRRIEMHLLSLCDQTVSVAGQRFDFFRGESLHTENAYKFTETALARLAATAGWQIRQCWMDPQQWFGVFLLTGV